LDHFKHPSVLQ